ncbi:MAG TPA: tripartite tricarboxylate transporter TctB family protein [Candidatus Binatia bacterium]|nr:tripartite tricarboxylate transporter TctB family protein [Candidatus Binatia bacterium]
MHKGSLFFCIFLIAIAAYATFAATGWSFKTKLFPLAVSIPLLTLLVIQLLLMIGGKERTGESAAMDIDFSIEVPPEVARRRVFGIFGWIVGFIALVYLLGFPLTVPLFIFIYLKFQSNIGWLSTIAITVVTWGCFYLLFQSLVHIQFEAGAIPTWLGM